MVWPDWMRSSASVAVRGKEILPRKATVSGARGLSGCDPSRLQCVTLSSDHARDPTMASSATKSQAKARTAYVCSECGADHNKWQGQCGECEAWNTLSEFVVEPAANGKTPARRRGQPAQQLGRKGRRAGGHRAEGRAP